MAPLATNDRYTALKRRLEDLERVHQDDKRSHLAETERLKTELARYQKQHAEQSDLVEKQKKQIGLLEARLQELKKAGGNEGSQIKDLRTKLRAVEHERSKLQVEAAQLTELRASLRAIEDARNRETKERDTFVHDLQTQLASEKQSNKILSSKYEELKRTTVEKSRATTASLQAQLDESRAEASQLKEELQNFREQSTSREDDLVSQLEQHRLLLSQVASEFGALASRSVPKLKYDRMQQAQLQVEVQNMRLERKLANSEAQVVELANLVRCVKEENKLLDGQLRDTATQLALSHEMFESMSPGSDCATFDDLFEQQLTEDALHQAQSDVRTQKLLACFYRRQAGNLAVLAALLHGQLRVSETLEDYHATQFSETLASHEAIAHRLETLQKEYMRAQENTGAAILDKERAEESLRVLEMKVSEQEAQLNCVDTVHQLALNKERSHIQRLNSTVQKQAMAEDALRDEIERLTNELASLEPYKDAFEQLNSRIDSLLARKKVAEDEAAELSEFNAQILGHHNAAQRIMYVDRIRRELAECKQNMADLLAEQEREKASNAALQVELDMYKSVMVPPAHKPKTHITRVSRMPLANMTQSLNKTSTQTGKQKGQLNGGVFTVEELGS
ncbi:hypothetical protein BKA70DRAFT_656426 [Coprinopsis sp. MPI-PUGE-AT-0042]|nr:hypothetical protein BKA70DRAFT_656426 [Coprinopsis sp. MPI-PUGE-AT-0042]